MDYPRTGDYIDIHNHEARPADGIFQLDVLMAHESRKPGSDKRIAYTAGIHPWFLSTENIEQQMVFLRSVAGNDRVIAIGEAGFDKLRGPSAELQKEAFARQAVIAGEVGKPMVIHCVKSWDELLGAHREVHPEFPWLIHGFRGKKELATQLLNRGFYLSLWFSYIMRQESAGLLRFLPRDRIFLETDGGDTPIAQIYSKAAGDMGISEEEMKGQIFSNFRLFFGIV